jgi:hypothetical protein
MSKPIQQLSESPSPQEPMVCQAVRYDYSIRHDAEMQLKCLCATFIRTFFVRIDRNWIINEKSRNDARGY